MADRPTTLPEHDYRPKAGVVSWFLTPILAHLRAFLVLNLLYFGVVILGMLFVAFNPQVQQSLLEAVGQALSPQGSLGPLVESYQTGRLLPAIGLTFLVNLILASLIIITAPSAFIPFWGVFFGLIRAALWGLLFSPFGGQFDASLLPHMGTLLLEGEGYIVAIFGVWLWWSGVFGGKGSRFRAWLDGLVLQGRIYLSVALLLIVAAIYEALEIILLIPRLASGA